MTYLQIDTPRLILRKLDPEVLTDLHHRNERQEMMRFYGLEDEGSLESEMERFKGGYTSYNRSFLYFQLLDRSDSRVLGNCGFHTWYLDHARAELFYHLYKDKDKSKGLMTEALEAVLEHGFTQMGLHRVEAMIGPDNLHSIALVTHFGFQYEGRLRGHYLKDGVYEDSIVYGLLKSEFGRVRTI